MKKALQRVANEKQPWPVLLTRAVNRTDAPDAYTVTVSATSLNSLI